MTWQTPRGVVRPSGANPSGSPGEPEGRAPQARFARRDARWRMAGDTRPWFSRRRSQVHARSSSWPRLGRRLPPADDGLWPRLSLLEPSVVPGRLLFVDLETTGLAGGAGTRAFLVGCGWFEGAAFRVRQFFLAGYAAERAMLDAVTEAAAEACGVVSYNGKSFDLPLIETRFLFHRMQTPFAGMPHVDMLHPARRLWRGERDDPAVPACGLATMDWKTILGTLVRRRVGLRNSVAVLSLRSNAGTSVRSQRCWSTTGSTCSRSRC